MRLCDMLFVVKAVSPFSRVLLWLGRGGFPSPPTTSILPYQCQCRNAYQPKCNTTERRQPHRPSLASPRVPCHTVYGTPHTSAYECVLLAAVGVLN